MLKIIVIGLIVFLGLGCSDWPTSREKVQEPYLTTMSFVLKNTIDRSFSEGAPGDTMELHAYFSGTPVTDIEWSVSYNVYKDLYGSSKAFDIQELSDSLVINGDDGEFTSATDVWAIKIPIPEDIFNISSSVDEDILAKLGIDKSLFLYAIDFIKERDVDSLFANPPDPSDSLATLVYDNITKLISSVKDDFYKIIQAFTVPVRVYAKINGIYNVRTDFAVRYNRFFDNHNYFKKIFVNHNPEVNYMVVHKFKKDPYPDFSESKFTDQDTSYILFLRDSVYINDIPGENKIFNDTIMIDSGYSYYVSVDSGFVAGAFQKDSATSLLEDKETKEEGSVSLENYYTHWYYEMDKEETELVPNYKDYMVINSSGNFMDNLYPPLDTRITKATLWVQIYDYFIGELLRVSGNGIHETSIYFKYTDRYKKSVAKN